MQFADTVAGVPFLVVPPTHERPDAPVVAAWHLTDLPSTEQAMAAALPLAGLDAWRIYFGLPLLSSRSPGRDEYQRLGYEDAVVNQFGPITAQAAAEFGAVYPTLRERFSGGPLAVLGGSIGSIVAQLVAVERPDVVAMALVSPVTRLRAVVAANERRFDVTYPWHPAAAEIADRLDFVARAGETARRDPAVRIVVGDRDDEHLRVAAAELRDALSKEYADPARVDLVTVPGMPHELAEGPEQTPTEHAAVVDQLLVDFLRPRLT